MRQAEAFERGTWQRNDSASCIMVILANCEEGPQLSERGAAISDRVMTPDAIVLAIARHEPDRARRRRALPRQGIPPANASRVAIRFLVGISPARPLVSTVAVDTVLGVKHQISLFRSDRGCRRAHCGQGQGAQSRAGLRPSLTSAAHAGLGMSDRDGGMISSQSNNGIGII